jgi:hypothetical protein
VIVSASPRLKVEAAANEADTIAWEAQTCSQNSISVLHSPIAGRIDFVEVFPAQFAVVVVGQRVLIHNAHAEAVFPNLADVTLDEKAGQIVRHLDGKERLEVN